MGIQGLGGVGKSTLASYFYHSLDFEAKFWADVRAKPDFTVFAEQIIIALDGKVNYPLDITQLINNLLQLLSQRRCLLVVDNLETLLNTERNWQDENYQQFFSRWKQQGINSTLFITTQDKPQIFQGLQHWYALGGMKLGEGLSLLKKLAIQGTEAELKAFVEYVDGHPLTLKLVAGYLREYYDSQLSQVEKLGLEKFELAYKEAEGLHRNQQDARLSWIIEQHLSRLSLEQTQFLIGLSVYRVPFDRQAATYMWQEREVKPTVIIKKLQELFNRSLLAKTQDNKFQFESLVQKYIQQQTNDLSDAHLRAIEYYQANLKEAESWQVLEDVREYLEIVDHHCELKQYALAKNILDTCQDFLDLRGYYSVLLEIHKKLIPKWQQNLQPKDLFEIADSLLNIGHIYNVLGDYSQAIEYSQQSLQIKQQIGDYRGEAASLNNLGITYEALGEYQGAIDFHQKSLQIKQQIGDLEGEATSLVNIGNTYRNLGKYQRAIDYAQQSLQIAQQIGDHHLEAQSVMVLGSAYHSLGEYQQAIDLYQQSLAIQQRIGNRYGEARSIGNLGSAYHSLGEYQRAIDLYQQSLAIQQQIGDRNGEANSLIGVGIIYSYLGEYQRAIDLYQNSLEISQQIGNRKVEGLSIINLGIAYSCLGEYQRAIDLLQQSLAITRQLGDHNGAANSLIGLGNAYLSLEEYQRAIDLLQQSLEIQEEIGDRNGEAKSLIGLGITYQKLQQKSEAKVAYENARQLYQEMGLDQYVEYCDQAIQDLDEKENN